MKIAIIGTRGIPNRYGGFETFAEHISLSWADKGHEVVVYNPSSHPFRQNCFGPVTIIRKPCPEKILGKFAILLYDFLCIHHAYHIEPDIILNCGYANTFFIRRKSTIPVITLTDGLEWKRSGWSNLVRRFFLKTERIAVKRSKRIVADHPEIAAYFHKKYGILPVVIPYGAKIPGHTKIPEVTTITDLLTEYTKQMYPLTSRKKLKFFMPNRPIQKIQPGHYFLMITRIVPENNIRMILKGYLLSGSQYPIVVVGAPDTSYGKRILKDFSRYSRIIFPGSIYKKDLLSLLSYHSRGYLHGHSVGGTNPSLLDAMAAGCLIAAHDNPFNRYVLGEGGQYFSSADEVAELLKHWNNYLEKKDKLAQENRKKIHQNYQWDKVAGSYEELFRKTIAEGRRRITVKDKETKLLY